MENISRRSLSLNGFDELQYRILRGLFPQEPSGMDGGAFVGRSKLRMQLGSKVVEALAQCDSVIDFGCGSGAQAIELARLGCKRVIGVDIQHERLSEGREAASRHGVDVQFVRTTAEKVDAVVSLDAFEHFGDPGAMLKVMHSLLKPAGRVHAAFGPTWLHPLGGHLFSIFPWAHLIFSETALCAWRSHLRDDGATCFAETAGGLNKMTISRFERLVSESPLELVKLECVPIRKLTPLHYRLTREWATAIVRVELKRV